MAKTAKKSAPAETKTKAKSAPAAKPKKPAATAKAVGAAKAGKAVAKAEKPAAPAKAAKPASKTERQEKPAAAAPKPAPAKAKPAVSKPTAVKAKPRETPASANYSLSAGGLAVKTPSKRPALSIAPGVMILGRSAVAAKTVDKEPKAGDRKLSKKELADIKVVLMERRERLLAGMKRELAVQRERAESKAADEIDKATDAYDEDLSFEIAAANDQELGEIQVALEKIENGTYGECEICGCPISPSRLKILPFATTCVACRGQEEMAKRRDDGNLLFNMMAGSDDAEGETGNDA